MKQVETLLHDLKIPVCFVSSQRKHWNVPLIRADGEIPQYSKQTQTTSWFPAKTPFNTRKINEKWKPSSAPQVQLKNGHVHVATNTPWDKDILEVEIPETPVPLKKGPSNTQGPQGTDAILQEKIRESTVPQGRVPANPTSHLKVLSVKTHKASDAHRILQIPITAEEKQNLAQTAMKFLNMITKRKIPDVVIAVGEIVELRFITPEKLSYVFPIMGTNSATIQD